MDPLVPAVFSDDHISQPFPALEIEKRLNALQFMPCPQHGSREFHWLSLFDCYYNEPLDEKPPIS